MKMITWTYIYTHIIITIRRQPSFSVFSSGDTNLISRDVGKAQGLRLTGTEDLSSTKDLIRELTSTKELASIKDLNNTSAKELTSAGKLISIKELTSTSTKELTNTKELTSPISTRKSRWSMTRTFQTGLLRNTRYVLVTLTCYSLFFCFSLPCECIFPLIPCSLSCCSLFFNFALPSKCIINSKGVN